MQALSSHYKIYKRVFLHPLMASKPLLVVRAGGGDDDLLRRGVQEHITDSQLSLNATGTTLGAPLAQVARSHIPAFSSFTTFSFSITASSLLFEPCGSFVVLIIGAIQGYEKIWGGL